MMTQRRSNSDLVRYTLLILGVMLAIGSSEAFAQMGDVPVYGKFEANEFEYAFNNARNPLVWDIEAWVGGDLNRFVFETEGEMPTVGVAVDLEAEALYARLVSPYWQVLVGVRGDLVSHDAQTRGRGHVMLGLSGTSRQLFRLEPAIYVSHQGDVSFRLEITHDLRITQRFIAETTFETDAAIQSVPEFAIGKGFNSIELGLRLRYEIVRQFALYLGVSWTHSFGETARLKALRGERQSDPRGVAGARFWF